MFLIVIVAIWGICSSCNKDETTGPDIVWRFSGTVVESVTGLPIDPALVSVFDTSGVTTYSDSVGRFSGLSANDIAAIFVRKSGYRTEEHVHDLKKDSVNISFELVPVSTQ